MEIKLFRIDALSFLEIDGKTIEVKDYRISNSMRGGTELEITIACDGAVTELSMSTTKESYQQ